MLIKNLLKSLLNTQVSCPVNMLMSNWLLWLKCDIRIAHSQMLLTMIYCILPVRCSAVGATAVMIGHQTLLSSGLSSYIINGSDGTGGRSGYVDANREGICSLLGYIAIYMYGVHLGRSFFKQRYVWILKKNQTRKY